MSKYRGNIAGVKGLVERRKANRTFSQKPKSRCHDVLQTPQIEKCDDATSKYVTWMPMHYVEACYGDSSCRPLAVTHTLKVGDRKLKIKLKRVDLVNSEAAFGNIQLFM